MYACICRTVKLPARDESWLGEYGMAALRLGIEKNDIPYLEILRNHIPVINHIDSTNECLLDFACSHKTPFTQDQ